MKDRFEGYYFKAQGEDKTLAVIAARHGSAGSESCSVQIISDSGVWSAEYPAGAYKSPRRGFGVMLGENHFSRKGMNLDIVRQDLQVKGRVKFGDFAPIKYDIMGPFSVVPFMECRHTVVSMRHRLDGQVSINGEVYSFNNAVGYIEGDRGTSFPSEYAWTQCCFEEGSLMLSAAHIPFGPVSFTGVIGVIMLGGREYRIATYLGAKAVKICGGEVVVRQGGSELTVRLIEKHARPLAAPVQGSMVRTIHESASCRAYYRFVRHGVTLLEFESDRATFEYEFPE